MNRILLVTCLSLLLLAGTVLATEEKPIEPVLDATEHIGCPDLIMVAYDWDFNISSWNWTTAPCDPNSDCVPHWQWGLESTITGNGCAPPYNMWATVLNGTYPNNAGESLLSPSWVVEEGAWMVEVTHYYDIETNYDGGNVTVNGQVVTPMGGYDIPAISTSTSFYACCTDLEPGWTGHDGICFRVDCFDLAPEWVGQEVTLGFDFGSDSSVTYPGWYIQRVRVGAPTLVDNEETTWGTLKSLYR